MSPTASFFGKNLSKFKFFFLTKSDFQVILNCHIFNCFPVLCQRPSVVLDIYKQKSINVNCSWRSGDHCSWRRLVWPVDLEYPNVKELHVVSAPTQKISTSYSSTNRYVHLFDPTRTNGIIVNGTLLSESMNLHIRNKTVKNDETKMHSNKKYFIAFLTFLLSAEMVVSCSG